MQRVRSKCAAVLQHRKLITYVRMTNQRQAAAPKTDNFSPDDQSKKQLFRWGDVAVFNKVLLVLNPPVVTLRSHLLIILIKIENQFRKSRTIPSGCFKKSVKKYKERQMPVMLDMKKKMRLSTLRLCVRSSFLEDLRSCTKTYSATYFTVRIFPQLSEPGSKPGLSPLYCKLTRLTLMLTMCLSHNELIDD